MNEDEVRRLVKEWHQRSRRERDRTSKFVFLWFSFNAWLAFESDKDVDRQMINWLKGSEGVRSRIRSGYELAAQSSMFQQYLDGLVALSPAKSRGRAPIYVRSRADFEAIVEAIYRIRCNLFHGARRPGDSRDQKLVILASCILEKWVGNLVGSWRF